MVLLLGFTYEFADASVLLMICEGALIVCIDFVD